MKVNLAKTHEPLNEAHRELFLREKEVERLQREVISVKKPCNSQANIRIEYEDIKVTNNFQLSRRQVYPKY